MVGHRDSERGKTNHSAHRGGGQKACSGNFPEESARHFEKLAGYRTGNLC